MTQISRELCRRLSLPTIIAGLTAIGPLHKVIRQKDYISIILICRGVYTQLKFDDEETAISEGYHLTPDEQELDIARDVPICVGTRCGRGCGCGCIRDLGYVDNSLLFISVELEPAACHTVHETSSLTVPEKQLFNLIKTKATINELIATYIQAFIDASKK